MALNMMVSKDLKLQPIGVAPGGNLSIDELNFNVENSITKGNQLYVILRGQKSNLSDILRLTVVRPYSKTHTTYHIVPGQKIRLEDEKVQMRILCLSDDCEVFLTTTPFVCTLKTEQYALTRQTALAQEIHLAVKSYYEQIVKMYNEIKERGTNE